MGALKNLFPARSKEEIREQAERELQEFLARGGSIQTVRGRKGPAKLTANGKTSGQIFTNVYN